MDSNSCVVVVVVVGLFRQICGGMMDTISKKMYEPSKKCYVRGN